jgi:protein-S-isoprenylcysteine O-methyltransferase Ste14
MLKALKNTFFIIAGSLLYIGIYISLKYLIGLLPDIKPWESIKYSYTVYNYNIMISDGIYFLLGLISFVLGFFMITETSRRIREVRDEKTRLSNRLMTDGCYNKMRHPMYASFILLQAGSLSSLRSLICTILAAFVIIDQYINVKTEEKNQLEKIFGDEYIKYKNRVKAGFMTTGMKISFAVIIGLSIIGLFF